MAESLADKLDCTSDRVDDNEVLMVLQGHKSKYCLVVLSHLEYDLLHFSCDMNIRFPKSAYNVVAQAVVKVNQRIWLGHFDVFPENRKIVFTLAIPFISALVEDDLVVEAAINLVATECDRFYDYFSMIAKGHCSCDDLFDAMFMDPLGEA